MPRPTLSAQQQERRKDWKNLFRAVLDSAPRPLGATEIAQAATEILRKELELGDAGISPSQVSHWRSDPATGTTETALRVPATEEQANALSYALSRLGAWTDEYEEHLQMEALVTNLGYELLELEELGEYRWRILKRTLDSDVIFFVSAKPAGYTGQLEILSNEKARHEWLRFLQNGKRWLVIAGLQSDRFMKSVKERSFSDWPYEFTGYAAAVDLGLKELKSGNDDGARDLYEQIRVSLNFAEIRVGEDYDRFCNPDSRILLGVNVSDTNRLRSNRWFREVATLGKPEMVGAIQHDDIPVDGAAFGPLGADRLKEIWNYLFSKLTGKEGARFYCLTELDSSDSKEELSDWLSTQLWNGSIFEPQ